jgi:hypothetical protein
LTVKLCLDYSFTILDRMAKKFLTCIVYTKSV